MAPGSIGRVHGLYGFLVKAGIMGTIARIAQEADRSAAHALDELERRRSLGTQLDELGRAYEGRAHAQRQHGAEIWRIIGDKWAAREELEASLDRLEYVGDRLRTLADNWEHGIDADRRELVEGLAEGIEHALQDAGRSRGLSERLEVVEGQNKALRFGLALARRAFRNGPDAYGGEAALVKMCGDLLESVKTEQETNAGRRPREGGQ